MKCIHIITPVKDSIELTLQTVDAIMASDAVSYTHLDVYKRQFLRNASWASGLLLCIVRGKMCIRDRFLYHPK